MSLAIIYYILRVSQCVLGFYSQLHLTEIIIRLLVLLTNNFFVDHAANPSTKHPEGKAGKYNLTITCI